MTAERITWICADTDTHIDALVDGELDVRAMAEFEKHALSCQNCQRAVAAERVLREMICASQPKASLGEMSRARMMESVRRASAKRDLNRSALRQNATLAMAALVLLGALGFSTWRQQRNDDGQAELATAIRVHSAALPADIEVAPAAGAQLVSTRVPSMGAASNTGTNGSASAQRISAEMLRTYFRKRLSFPVEPAAFAGARLVGARYSGLHGRDAAALYYRVGQARVTVFVVDRDFEPSRTVEIGNEQVGIIEVAGRDVAIVQRGGLSYAFVGELPTRKLAEIAASADIATR